jgi:hypothetical protein
LRWQNPRMSSQELASQENEWRRLYQASIIARERLRRAEAVKTRIMEKLERLEESMMAQDGLKPGGETHERPLRGW